MTNEHAPETTNLCDSQDVLTVGRLFQHLKEPQNLLNYLILSAWLKFMNITQHIPTITIG